VGVKSGRRREKEGISVCFGGGKKKSYSGVSKKLTRSNRSQEERQGKKKLSEAAKKEQFRCETTTGKAKILWLSEGD